MYAGKARLDSDRVHRGELDKVKCLVKCKADVNATKLAIATIRKLLPYRCRFFLDAISPNQMNSKLFLN